MFFHYNKLPDYNWISRNIGLDTAFKKEHLSNFIVISLFSFIDNIVENFIKIESSNLIQ